MWKRSIAALAVAAVGAFGLAAGAAKAEVTVGGKNFTEQLLLAEMTGIYLEDQGYDVSKRDGMGSTVLRRAQENGQVDVYWEYVGTSLIVYNKVEGGASMSPDKAYAKVKELDAEKGLVWLEPSNANNTYALAMREKQANDLGIESISDMIERIENEGDLTLAVNSEFAGRPDGLPGLQKHYDFRWPRENLKRMQSGLIYQALKEGQVDIGLVFATDGRIAAFDFITLDDNKNFFPNYALTPVVRKDTLEENPDLREQLNALSAKLNDQVMRKLNQRVDVDKETVEDVARSFLESEGLI
ncbi:glycine betaine ABC transporter substrate-binding protein [Ferruginivarius sediminum]|uniref:Glycine/betaine ABC transporter substrate-binding protein n=1 Tax=Ferruginivarius sediminum TaxID=2661937 RepID=A0A369T7L7_9PROT|nr:glycine betaine ABC transporter substrate-binding protein [Ferruginivarius sediminum]RDD61300.1 glycine/betaine ABC transporter substrate-binding protein [Ferruginivarius sediminum]